MRKALVLLLLAAAVAGAGALLLGRGADQRHAQASRRTLRSKRAPATAGATARSLLGLPRLHGSSALPGYLMIADRDNNRIIVVTPGHRVAWVFPHSGQLRAGQHFAGPDDAFLTPSGRSIITNEEFSDTVARVSLGRHPRVAWEYGHAGSPGSAPGYLAHPDDAYVLPDGNISVADIINCRVLVLSPRGRILRSIGRAGACTHDPPRSIEGPNGDTPLPDGGVLVTEIGGWIDRFDRHGRLVFSIRAPTTYPSDAQLLPDGNVLVAGFNTPGRVDILTPKGKIVWTYQRSGGPGALDRPSLAVAFPNGTIAVTDDWHHRVVLIDRHTKRIVWQYGHLGQAGTGRGYLNKPDGLQLIS